MILNLFRRRNDRARQDGIGKVEAAGIGSFAAGVAAIAPGPKDVGLAWLNKQFGPGIPLETTWPLGLALMFAGCFLLAPYLRSKWAASRPVQAVQSPPAARLLAFRHQSINRTLPRKVSAEDLPESLKRLTPTHVDCDQTLCLSDGAEKLTKALTIQEDALDQVIGDRRLTDDSVVAYYGLAHIPLQILAGHTLNTTLRPALFELNHETGGWRPILDGDGKHLSTSLQRVLAASEPKAAIIRVSVSAPIASEDATAIIEEPFDEFHVSVATPERNIVTHHGQIEVIAQHVRGALDEASRRLRPGGRIHLFAAVPMSVGFSIGRMISKSMHVEVVAYNFAIQRTPRYPWGIRINVNERGAPQLVRPKLVGLRGTVGEEVE